MSITPSAIEAWEVLDLLTSLVQKSLVVYEEDEQGRGRYHLLETVRQYARDRLRETGEGEAVRGRHLSCFLALAEEAEPELWRDAAWLERLESEHDNLRGALDWCAGGNAEAGLRLAGALGAFWFDRGYWNEGREWLERALAGAPGAEPAVERARALVAAGQIATYQPDYPAARNRLEESIALCRALGDTRGLAEALTYLSGALRLREGDRTGARRAQEEAVALARTLGDPRLLAMTLSVLGLVIGEIGEPQAARMLLEESLVLARQVGDRALMAQSLESLRRISQLQGDLARARELLEESVELARAAKNKSVLFWALFNLARLLSQQGDHERGESLAEECLLLAREFREVIFVGRAILLLVTHVPSCEEAFQMIEQAACEYGPQAAIRPLGALGHRARERGDYEQAANCYRRSLVLRQEAADTFAIAQSLEDFAGLAARQQQWERAATLLGAAEGVCVETGSTLPVAVPEDYERAVRGAHAALGKAAFAAAWAEGRTMSLEAAVEYTLTEGEAPKP